MHVLDFMIDRFLYYFYIALSLRNRTNYLEQVLYLVKRHFKFPIIGGTVLKLVPLIIWYEPSVLTSYIYLASDKLFLYTRL